MSAPARAVEDQPLAAGFGGHEERSVGADAPGHLIHFRDRGFDPPGTREDTVRNGAPVSAQDGERAEAANRHRGQAAQTCSRNGSVSPRPSFPEAASQ